ncbi:hypothetical protein [Uliginosibacterium gangwonense]|uniref:hypothetical protein n=1 Tax=Uliginosibacterium gangwonense TaxID=392736 RepID=UPI0003690BD2|nr:hypothetical protein [Uliginosibacterium gangwonense]
MSFPIPLKRLRVVLALPAIAALVIGVFAGLARIGVALPGYFASLTIVHGALMVGGLFGTLIGLERAVALARGWPYLAPALSGAGAVCLLVAPSSLLGAWLMLAASLVMTWACFDVWRGQRAIHLATLAAAALAWSLGNAVWLTVGTLIPAVPLWMAFLILTIAGERLELSRFVPTPRWARRLLAAVCALLLIAATLHSLGLWGLHAYALALLMLAAWLLRFDVARRTIRTAGLTRYMAICLLSGYVWLAIGAVLGLAGALPVGDPLRDAALHSILLGFVISMVFGHAPIIVPALTRLSMRWHPGFYIPLAVLQITLMLRVASAWNSSIAWREWGAIGNAIALLIFFSMIIESLLAARDGKRVRREVSHGNSL